MKSLANQWLEKLSWLFLERRLDLIIISCRAAFGSEQKMSQKVIKRKSKQEKPLKTVHLFLSQGSFQGEINVIAKSQSQGDASQASQVASQGQVASQVLTQDKPAPPENVSSQDSVSTQARDVSSQPVVPTLSQLSSQKSVPTQSQGCIPSQNQSQLDEKENIDQSEIDFAKAEYSRALQRIPSQNSQHLKNSSWLLRSGQSDSQGRDYLTSCTELLLNDQKSDNQKTDE